MISNASVLLASLSRVNPREKYKSAWKVLDSFRAEVPAKQATAMPPELAFALAGSAVLAGQHEVGSLPMGCFVGLWRGGLEA